MLTGPEVGHTTKKVDTHVAKTFNYLCNAAKGLLTLSAKPSNGGYSRLASSDDDPKNELRKVHNPKADTQAPPGAPTQRTQADRLSEYCRLLSSRDGIIKGSQWTRCLNAALKLDPQYRREPLEHLVSAASKLDRRDAFVTATSEAIDKLPEDQRVQFDVLHAAVLTRASQTDYYQRLNIEEFGTLIDDTDRLPPELRNAPLNNLARAIFRLPDQDTFKGYDQFKGAYERLPDEFRKGLTGIYEAGLNHHRSELNTWENAAARRVLNHIDEAAAPDAVKQWHIMADAYGLSSSGKEQVRTAIVKSYANPEVDGGANVADILKRYGLDDEASCVEVHRAALSSEKLRSALKACKDYLEVANEYGVTHEDTMREMSRIADQFYRQGNNMQDAP
jgi:hypothetical protein